MYKKKSKKIKDLKGLSFKAGNVQGNRVKPVNGFVPFEKEAIRQSVPERFEAMVKRYPEKLAVKSGNDTVSYETLNKKANRTAHRILREGTSHRSAALLFGHGIDQIAAVLGVLKSGLIYVPLDPGYPPHRLEYMLKDSNTRLIVTDRRNAELALKLKAGAAGGIEIIDIDALPRDISGENPGVSIDPVTPAYILYTSGSTGKPKGVMQNHCNVLHHVRVYTNALHINKDDRLTLFSSYSFDAAKMDIYGALLNGAALYPYDIKADGNLQRMPRWIREEKITIYHSIPTVYRYFTDMLTASEPDRFPHLRFIVLGGEAVLKKDIDNYKKLFEDHCLFINGLGPTESTVTVQYFIGWNTEITREAVPVGYPVDETQVYLLNDQNKETGMFGVGEIVFKSGHLALGYVNKPGQTFEAFTPDPVTGTGRVYRTGDLGRRLPDGSIEYAGRKDFQVKVRGYRIESGEIESLLDRAPGIKKSVVECAKENNGENFLAAYYTGTGETEIHENQLIKHLKTSLPDYMIPSVFLRLPEFPLTPTGKIDRKELSRQDIAHLLRPEEPEAPGNPTETRLAELWKDLLKLQTIGVNENFFVLGGNSLKAVLMVSRVHKELGVEISITDIFEKPTIKELATYVDKRETSVYEDIEPAEKREYYPLSSAQERLFVLNRFDNVGTGFNMTIGLRINGILETDRYEDIMKALIQRHEVLRTSFHLIDDQPVQRVHDTVDFKVERYAPPSPSLPPGFIRPFDISEAPLLRVGIVSRSSGEHYLLYDAHHIVFDGSSLAVLVNDFMRLYEGNRPEPLKIQYKDFTLWQNNLFEAGKMQAMEKYWLELYPDAVHNEIPRLNLPLDFPRPEVMSYEGDSFFFNLGKEETSALKTMALEEDVSLFMLLLAIYNVTMAKITRQTDIITASIVSGRNHRDTENVIGVFVNMLALRNFPEGEKTFREFLTEVKESTLNAFENRDYPFETLVEKLPGSRNISRHPLMDIGFTLQNA
ncbi:MAG: amino acid adenylation domain-containing protein, partial [bacterium]|nr:amino acid adenylation domain-containing protein [bacterium]